MWEIIPSIFYIEVLGNNAQNKRLGWIHVEQWTIKSTSMDLDFSFWFSVNTAKRSLLRDW